MFSYVYCFFKKCSVFLMILCSYVQLCAVMCTYVQLCAVMCSHVQLAIARPPQLLVAVGRGLRPPGSLSPQHSDPPVVKPPLGRA